MLYHYRTTVRANFYVVAKLMVTYCFYFSFINRNVLASRTKLMNDFLLNAEEKDFIAILLK